MEPGLDLGLGLGPDPDLFASTRTFHGTGEHEFLQQRACAYLLQGLR
jgi:hypothetical protein